MDALKPFHEAFQGYYVPVQLDPRLTFEAFARASGICLRPGIWRLLAGEPTAPAQTCGECGGSGEVTVQTYLSGVRASIPCPVCQPAQTEAGAE